MNVCFVTDGERDKTDLEVSHQVQNFVDDGRMLNICGVSFWPGLFSPGGNQATYRSEVLLTCKWVWQICFQADTVASSCVLSLCETREYGSVNGSTIVGTTPPLFYR